MKITKTKTFNVAPDTLQQPVEVKFMNKKGSFDSIQFSKFKTSAIKTSQSTFNTSEAVRIGKVNTNKTNTYYSLWLDEKYFQWLEELFASPVVLVDNKYVRVADSSYSYDNSEKLFSIELTTSPEFGSNNIRF